MLDLETLSQLSSLKDKIQASKEFGEGSVAATSGRFGFVRLDDGRDAFLAPEKMDRLLPGDRVKVELVTNDKGKLEASLEKLKSSELTRFVGQYRVKGAGHFVVPSGMHFNRWIFVPPQNRKGAKDGDFVIARISKHPYSDGKAQSKVVFKIGQPDDNYIEHKYVKAKYELNSKLSDTLKSEIGDIQAQFDKADFQDREDYRHLDFVTIDSATTLDMDDAIAVEKNADDSHTLFVAIADPSSFITTKSALARDAESAAQSVYLLGGAVGMLPAQLAHYGFSLEENKDKPALLCKININKDGEINNFVFVHALMRSRHKLSYEQVAAFIDGKDSEAIPESIAASVEQLFTLSSLRRTYREKHYLVADDQPDYEYRLGESGKITEINVRERNSAQQIVEESMIACNRCAGDLLREHSVGLFNTHKGFREDRLGEVHALLKEEGVEHGDLNALEGHVALMKSLSANPKLSLLIPALRRMMQAGELSAEPGPHLGMGVPAYATVTSPIRRFADLYNHWKILAIIAGETTKGIEADRLIAINEALRNGRQADRELQQWLITQYTQSLIGNVASGKIRIVTQQGFGLRLHDNGIEGFVLFPKNVEKQYDAKRMTLTVDQHCYRIEQEVSIKVSSVDMDKRRVAFELAEKPSSENTE